MPNDPDMTGEQAFVTRVPTGRLRSVGVSVAPDPAAPMVALTPDEGEAIFELLVAVMWSDGDLATAEVERGRAAAEIMQIRPSRGGAFGAIAAGPLPFGEIDFDNLSLPARRLAYAAAEWVADAAPDPSERKAGFVRALQLRLAIDDDDARVLGELALGPGREQATPRRGFRVLMQGVLQRSHAPA